MQILSNQYRVQQEQITSQRQSAVDICRFLAAFGVVTAHAHANTAWATKTNYFFILFCVPFFFTASLYYFITSLREPIPVKKVLLRMGKRIGIPFLAWSVIYTALLVVKHLLVGKNSTLDFTGIFLYGNSAEHLYYLPELFIMQMLALAIALLATRRHLTTAVLLAAISVAYLSLGYWQAYFGVTPVGSIAVYLAVGFYLSYATKTQKVGRPYSLVGGVLICVGLYNWLSPYTAPLIHHVLSLPIAGVGLFLVVSRVKSFPASPWFTTVMTATYGVYLSHVMFLEFFEFLLEKNNIAVHYDIVTKFAVGTLIFSVAIIATLLIRKNALLRVLLLGESN